MFTTWSTRKEGRAGQFGIAMLMCLSLILGALPSRARAQASFQEMIQHDFAFAAQQLNHSVEQISITRYPSTTKPDGSWNTTSASTWTSGFFPGALWRMYERTSDPAWRTQAEQRQAGIESQKNRTDTHDLGFMIFISFGNGYRLTGTEAFRQVVLTASESLSKRYSPIVGCVRSSGGLNDSDFKVIIDTMMNLEMLFWSSRQPGGKHEWYDMAFSHALKTRGNHVRTDGSTFQGVTYSASTGNVKSKWTNQGYSKDSTWSRGQAWAVYGFTVAYRETGDQRFLETARKTADYFIANLPSDKVPYWDFYFTDAYQLTQPKDSSAAAIGAAGLLELSKLDPDAARQQTYLDSAKAILTSLSSPAYLAEGTSNRAILLHGTRNNNDDDADSHDTGLIYGDYYFLEALLRASEPTQPPVNGTISGRVTDRTTDLPLLGATITSSRGTTSTDANGQYTVADIVAGNQTISAVAPGYEQAQQTVVVPEGGSVSADFALNPTGQPPLGDPIKAITFEAGSLIGPSGADSVSGVVVRETAAPIKGTASARIPNNATGYLTENFDAEDELFVSFYLRLHARPTNDVRIAFISNDGTTVGNIQLRSSGTLRLRSGSTIIGAETAALNVGQVYRIRLHQKAGTGGNAVLEGYVAQGDAPFGAPFAATTTGTWTSHTDRLRFGATNGNVLDATFDDIMLDRALMSSPAAAAR